MTKRSVVPALPPAARSAAFERDDVVAETKDAPARITLQALAVTLTLSQHRSEMLREGCRERMVSIKTGLGYDSAPELERLLIDEIALCWLRLGEAETMYSQVHSATHQPAKAAYAERRLSACLARYTRACEALARVRRLSRGVSLQVNIAGQQIVTG
jgi:hypothetical protein